MKLLKELGDGEKVFIQALVGNVTQGTNKSGAPYLNVELRDATGQIQAKKWEVSFEDDTTFVIGNVAEITAEIIKYKDALQAKIISARLLKEDEMDN